MVIGSPRRLKRKVPGGVGAIGLRPSSSPPALLAETMAETISLVEKNPALKATQRIVLRRCPFGPSLGLVETCNEPQSRNRLIGLSVTSSDNAALALAIWADCSRTAA